MINKYIAEIVVYKKLLEINRTADYLLDSDNEERLITNLPTVIKISIVFVIAMLTVTAVMQIMKKTKK